MNDALYFGCWGNQAGHHLHRQDGRPPTGDDYAAEYYRFLEEARKELDAKNDTKTLLDGLLSLRGWKTPAARQERARILGELEGRLAAVHIQRITVGKMKRTLLSYRTPKKAKKS